MSWEIFAKYIPADWYPEYTENSELENNKTNDPLLFFEQTLHQRKDTDDK